MLFYYEQLFINLRRSYVQLFCFINWKWRMQLMRFYAI